MPSALLSASRLLARPSRALALRCLPAVGAAFGLLSAAHGQLMVTVNPGGASSAAAAATTVTFNEVNPATFYGTGGTQAIPTKVYTSPATLPNATTNGTASFATTTAFNGATSGPLVAGSASGQYSQPTSGSLGTYLALGGSNYIGSANTPATLTMTFSKASGIHDVGLFWGSPDTSNKAVITLSDNSTQTFVPGTNTSNGFTLPATAAGTAYVTFSSAATSITSVVFSSSQAAFEFDDVSFGVNAVPEPATWLGAGLLLGAAGLAARRRFTRRAAAL